ncbi:hypothetical protein ABZ793_06080 [Micromonospora sp. NPDC047465]|uniref:hypothetical protein n=1 Tax=Micromonospora sp. NPDC047465 TaxID=3154813 RepID=UPI003404B079
MAEIRIARTARKTHRCGSETGKCHTTIQPGDRYLLASLPPDSEMGNTDWWHLKVCRGCAEVYGQSMEEQVTPRRSTRRRRPRTRPAQHRRHVDEPRFDRPVIDVHLPATDAA